MAKPASIVWFNWKDRDHPLAGGAEVVNEELAARLAADGHTVTFITGGLMKNPPALPRFKLMLCGRIRKQELSRRIIIGLPVPIRVIRPVGVVAMQASAVMEAALANCSRFECVGDGAR